MFEVTSFCQVSPPNPLCASPVLHVCHMHHLSHLALINLVRGTDRKAAAAADDNDNNNNKNNNMLFLFLLLSTQTIAGKCRRIQHSGQR